MIRKYIKRITLLPLVTAENNDTLLTQQFQKHVIESPWALWKCLVLSFNGIFGIIRLVDDHSVQFYLSAKNL